MANLINVNGVQLFGAPDNATVYPEYNYNTEQRLPRAAAVYSFGGELLMRIQPDKNGRMTQELFFNIYKISFNEWNHLHWARQKSIKQDYKVMVNQITKAKRIQGTYEVEYHFKFINNPLDAVNCFIMVKILEDLLFVHDEYNKITSMTINSNYSDTNKDYVKIVIKEVERK